MPRGVHRPEPDVAGRHDLVIDKRPPAGIVEGRVALGPGELVEAGLGPALGDGTDARDVVAVGVGDEDAVEAAAQPERLRIVERGGKGVEVLGLADAGVNQRGFTGENEVGPVALPGEGAGIVGVQGDDVHGVGIIACTRQRPLSGAKLGFRRVLLRITSV